MKPNDAKLEEREVCAVIAAPLAPQEVSTVTMHEKYAKGDDASKEDIFRRVARGIAACEKHPEVWEPIFYRALQNGWIGGGRIMSAAGTAIDATLINCFVQPVSDSMQGIFQALGEAAETMRRGGGEGYNFSAIRPKDAFVKGTHSRASGPLSYMDCFDAMCKTVESAGSRRGAQMAVLNVSHPDIEDFIGGKYKKGALNNFNMSVGVSDAFMVALLADADWELVHEAQPCQDLIDLGARKRDDGLWVYRKVMARDLWKQIMDSTYHHAEPGVLFMDRANRDNNLYYVEKIEATNPCGEQFLPPYGCCDLGSLDITRFVVNPFTPNAYFDFDKMREVTAVAVRFLDNVLDVTLWPLEQQKTEAANKRRIGVGYTGLGDTLIMLEKCYDSDEGRELAVRITREMTEACYIASVELAKEKGPFPLFDAEKYLGGENRAARLPEAIKAEIRKYGIRNSHLNSIAPTGTISLAFADNASNGIEPPFSWWYQRNVRQPDGSKKAFIVEDAAYRLYKHVKGIDSDTTVLPFNPDVQVSPGVVFEKDGKKQVMLPSYFRSALDMAAKDHAAMVAAVQPYIDSAISKTVNVPADYPFEEFVDLYIQAYKDGCKGITTYRPNDVLGAVLEVAPTEKADDPNAFPQVVLTDADIRLVLKSAPQPALASLEWPSRPKFKNGNMAWSYIVDTPSADFAIFVGEDHRSDGSIRPFEVWVNGAEQPRALGAVAKLLSVSLRANDHWWTQEIVNSLCSIVGDDGFDLEMPPDGEVVRMPSLVAAFGRIVRHRMQEVGAFTPKDGAPTPMRDSLFTRVEPRTGPNGTMAWAVDVENPSTGDQFVATLKELALPDGTRRPYSLSLSGFYPRALDGLCALLNRNMRIMDPAWIGMCLEKLLDFSEPRGDFMARVPGGDTQQVYPSTVAYLARLLVHRFSMLGLLTESGAPTDEVAEEAVSEAAPKGVQGMKVQPGKQCKECGAHAVIKKDGCELCTQCGALGSCG